MDGILWFVGGSDQSKEIDVNVWIDAMLNESMSPPSFYPAEFEDWANDVIFGTDTREYSCI
jgi:hypothetical protein